MLRWRCLGIRTRPHRNDPMTNGFLDLARDFGDLAAAGGQLAQQVPGVRTAAKAFCRVAAGTPGQALFNALDIQNVCTPFLAEDGRGFGSQGPPPFLGGQCPGELYNVSVNAFFDGAPGPSNPLTDSGPGPVSVVTGSNPGGGTFFEFSFDGSPSVRLSAGASTQETTFEVVSITRVDGQPDDCGDPEGEFQPGEGYDGEQFGDPQTIEGPDGRDYEIVVDPPSANPGGGLSIPISIDGTPSDLGDPPPGPAEPSQPDYDNPGDPVEPSQDPEEDDEIDSNQLVSAVTVVITQSPPNKSSEVGGPENIRVAGEDSDAGWFRWKAGGSTTTPQRLLSQSNHYIFSPGICAEAEGFQVKFSFGYSGFAIPYLCTKEDEQGEM